MHSKPGQTEPSILIKFVSAGLAASVAEAVTIPIDTAKVRLQIQGENAVLANVQNGVATANSNVQYRGMIGSMITVAKTDGFRSLYKGLVPGIHRQLCFASIRIGLYDTVKEFYGDDDVNNPKVIKKILASCTTGVFAVSVAQPTEVAKVRFQADGSRFGSNKALDAYMSIFKNEGLRGLWKGAFANMARLSTVNASELVVYDMVKGFFLRNKLMADDFPLHFVSAFGAGFATTVVASPVDVVKTRYMNSPPNTYKSAIHCAYMLLKHNGPLAYYKGFTPNFMRLGAWNIVMFMCFEQLKRLFSSFSSEH
ncbi:mitochondrial uncoupling protein 2-like [Stylophora pistillata]|uniref:Mitochondrial uncoupling protein 2 n=1 Tax=Stylophora pistillata TaxID=50429 RepID=A0A2B4SG22_STYPI|nr:mitochondrial uncoupling protein 2-like [Stylophora pistillata]PFX28316.1 Mitochondrial uncoupling protein 2 [Stylophora pistillata]